jgi:hypothetical protein
VPLQARYNESKRTSAYYGRGELILHHRFSWSGSYLGERYKGAFMSRSDWALAMLARVVLSTVAVLALLALAECI